MLYFNDLHVFKLFSTKHASNSGATSCRTLDCDQTNRSTVLRWSAQVCWPQWSADLEARNKITLTPFILKREMNLVNHSLIKQHTHTLTNVWVSVGICVLSAIHTNKLCIRALFAIHNNKLLTCGLLAIHTTLFTRVLFAIHAPTIYLQVCF